MESLLKPLTTSEINGLKPSDLAQYIDHTLLKANAQLSEIQSLCDEAKLHGIYSVCVNSSRVSFAASLLEGTNVKVCSVVGFPLGAMSSEAKAFEAKRAVEQGAHEIDMVLNIGALKEQDLSLVCEDIAIVRSAIPPNVVLKVIIETCLLTNEEKKTACTLAVEAGANFVKTSTGFSTAGASVEDISLMRSVVGDSIGVKASGGVRTYADALAMLRAGATRIGSGNGVAVITSTASSGDY